MTNTPWKWGVLYGFLSSQFMAANSLLVSFALNNSNLWIVMFFGYVISSCFCAVFMSVNNITFQPVAGEKIYVTLHSIFFATTDLFLNYSLMFIAASDAVLLVDTNFILAALIAYCLLKEPIDMFEIIFMLTSLFGVVLWARPDLVTGQAELALSVEQTKGLALGLCASISYATASLTNRRIPRTNPYVITLYAAITSVFVSLIMVFTDSSWKYQLEPMFALYVVLYAFFSFSSTIQIGIAYQLEDTSYVSLANSMDLPAVYIVQSIIDISSFDKLRMTGTVLMIAGFVLFSIKRVLCDKLNYESYKCFLKKKSTYQNMDV